MDAAERVADGGLVFHRYASVPAALHAIDEQDHPIVVLATWATVLFAAMLVVSHRLRRSPGEP